LMARTRYPAAVGFQSLRPIWHSVHRARGRSRQLARAAVRLRRTDRLDPTGGSTA
jgi:hypothetical protein